MWQSWDSNLSPLDLQSDALWVALWSLATAIVKSRQDHYIRNFSLLWIIVKELMILEGRLRSINSWLQIWSELIFTSAPKHHVLVDNNSHQRKNILILTRYIKENQHRCNVLQGTVLQWTSTEVNVYMQCHQTCSFATTTLTTYMYIIVVWSR